MADVWEPGMNRAILVVTLALLPLCMGLTAEPAPGGPRLQAVASTLSPEPVIAPQAAIVTEQVVYATSTAQTVTAGVSGGLTGSIGHASPFGNCVLEPGVKKQPGNPISWRVTTQQPYIGATALWHYNHVGVVVGIWANGDLEIAHQNYRGGQHRFARSQFRGFN